MGELFLVILEGVDTTPMNKTLLHWEEYSDNHHLYNDLMLDCPQEERNWAFCLQFDNKDYALNLNIQHDIEK